MNPIKLQLKLARSAAATGLSLTAKSLSLASKAAGAVARLASRDTAEPAEEPSHTSVVISGGNAAQTTTTEVSDTPTERVEPDSDEAQDRRGRVIEPASVPVPDAPSRVRTHDSHAAELAAKPAAEVIRAIDGLSTDELAHLLEQEQGGRKRKSVLAAIERALLPPVSSEEVDRDEAAGPAPAGARRART